MIFLRIVSDFPRNILFVLPPKLADDFPAVRRIGAKTKKIDPVPDREDLRFVVQLQIDHSEFRFQVPPQYHEYTLQGWSASILGSNSYFL